MASIVNPEPEPVSTTPVQPSSADPATAGNVAAANKTTTKDFTIDTQIGSLNDLREKAPEVYDKMLMGIAQSIVARMREQQERLKKMMREGREDY